MVPAPDLSPLTHQVTAFIGNVLFWLAFGCVPYAIALRLITQKVAAKHRGLAVHALNGIAALVALGIIGHVALSLTNPAAINREVQKAAVARPAPQRPTAYPAAALRLPPQPGIVHTFTIYGSAQSQAAIRGFAIMQKLKGYQPCSQYAAWVIEILNADATDSDKLISLSKLWADARQKACVR